MPVSTPDVVRALESVGDAEAVEALIYMNGPHAIFAVSGEDLPVRIDEPLALRFVPAAEPEEEELELAESDLDEIPFEGHVFDLGEAVAQSLALAIDPYATGPEAERVRKEAGLSDEAASGPFAALAALKEPKS